MDTTHDGGSIHDTPERTTGQWMALILGTVFTLIGIAGFFVTGFEDFANNSDKLLLGLEVNPLHNLVHLGLGIAGLVMWRTRELAKAYGWLTFVGYGATFVYGLFATGDDRPNLLSLNTADNVLHIVLAFAGLATALLADRRRAPLTTGHTRPV